LKFFFTERAVVSLPGYVLVPAGAGDRDGGGAQLRRAAGLAQRLVARPLSDDIALLARRARIPLSQPGDAADARAAPARSLPCTS
jgi:hypothetical protein